MSSDPNWLAPPPGDDEPTSTPASEITAHKAEAAPTVAAAPLEKQQPVSVWLILALIGGLVGLVASCLTLTLIPFTLISPARSSNATAAAIASFISLSGIGLLGTPLAWYAVRRLRSQAAEVWQTEWFWVAVSGIVVVIALVAGQILLTLHWFTGLVGFAQYLATVLAALVLLALVMGRWACWSKLRVWSHLLSGAWLSVPIAFIVEWILIVFVAILTLGALYFFARSDFDQLLRLAQLLSRSRANISPALLLPLATKPWAIGLGFFLLSFLMPAVEELLKPLGVILLLGRKPAPMEAFIGGVLGGLGFAIIETLGNLTPVSEVWLFTILARMGTMVMHALTAGLVGWGWGQVAASRNWWGLGRAYVSALFTHGLWNGAVISIAFLSLRFPNNFRALPNAGSSMVVIVLVLICVLLLIGLTVGGLAMLIGLGHHFRKKEIAAT